MDENDEEKLNSTKIYRNMRAVISNVKFSPLGSDDIRKVSVLEITKTKADEEGSVFDQRLGPAGYQKAEGNRKIFCPTCKLEELKCPGHFGHICLNFPIIHPLFVKYVLKLLRMFCFNCGRFMFIKLDDSFPHFEAVVAEKTVCMHCCFPQPAWSFSEEAVIIKCDFQAKNSAESGRGILQMTPREVSIILANFNKEDLARIHFTTHPENLIIELLPVCPPCVRPPLYIDGQLHDDHLTIQYNEIVKINQSLRDGGELDLPNLKKLTFKIRALFVEKKGGATGVGTVTKPAIKRISGKKGHMRDSIMGKRVDRSGRTVIGPEPTLLINQVGIPLEMAESLTVKEVVCKYNVEELNREIRRTSNIKFITRKDPSGEEKSFHAAYVPDTFLLQEGDILDRKLRTGDTVVINRQPTLHCGSLIAFEAVVQSGRTIRFNLSNTKTFNADFDGDEMNIHVPQMYNARCELEELSSIKNHLCSEKNGRPNIVLVQDNILALFLMTEENMDIEREEFFDLMMLLVDEKRAPVSFDRINTLLADLKAAFPDSPYCSRAVISMCFPNSFSYEKQEILIRNGMFVRGVFDKKAMNSIFDIIYHIYPSNVSEMVVNNLQRVSNQWLRLRGFSIGLEDCTVKDKNLGEKIEAFVQKSFYEASLVESSVRNPNIREVKVQEALNKAQSIGMRISKEGFDEDNNFLKMIKSGSKGDYFNVAQICGLLGQQYIKGARSKLLLNHGLRSLYHFDMNSDSLEDRFSSRGMIRGNFLQGLSPKEMFFHGEAGRSGVVDTAMGTSETGYMHRRIIKLTEDEKVVYDGSVRNDTNRIIQFVYGNGLDTTKSPNPKYLHNIADMLNFNYEKGNI